jgi:class 3 adenylate cyclase/FixJ family two-component response regulator
MTKILVADDEADLESLIKQKFRKQIRDQHYEFVFAMNGREALEKLKEHPDTAMLLSDINMPEMDGLTLLTRIKEVNPILKSVIISAYGDMDNIRTAMNRGAFDFLTKPVNFDDLEITMEKTIKYVTQLKETVKALKENNILRMYVDESVLNFMNQKEFEDSVLVNETIIATVAFIDITGFTMITERETPDNVILLLNQYFDIIAREIINHGGYVDKFIGDEVMAVFRCDFHLDKAIDATLAIRRAIEALPDAGSGHYHPKVSVGINSGEMISGNIGSAGLKRLDYTVIGDVVNTAKRLQAVAREGEIIISESCYEKVKESFKLRKVGEVALKNKANPMAVYQVLD